MGKGSDTIFLLGYDSGELARDQRTTGSNWRKVLIFRAALECSQTILLIKDKTKTKTHIHTFTERFRD